VAGSANGTVYDAQGHITGSTPILPTEVPIATTTDVGGVYVPANSGLSIGNDGELDHSQNVTANTISGLTFNDTGHITNAVPLASGDIPTASPTVKGGVIVPGPILTVANTGAITHTDSGVSAGTYTKVTVNSTGHVTTGAQLVAADVPGLDASKIVSGQLGTAFYADNSITRFKLADYSISYIQESQPTEIDPGSIGMLWLQESTAQLRMWNGNSWFAVGLGRLVQENLRWGGLIDASTGLVTVVTRFGLNAGLAVGAPLPDPIDQIGGLYVVIEVGGSNIGQTPGVNYDEGDWCLCVDQANGWTRIDTLSGGGGGAQFLNDLLDVNITNVQDGDTLVFDAGTGRWVNVSTNSEKVTLIEPFDNVRTVFNTPQTLTTPENLIVSLGGVIQDPGVDFTIPTPNQIAFAEAPPVGTEYFILQESTVSTSGGGGISLPPGTAAEEYLQWDNTLGSWQPSTTFNGGTY